MKYIAYGFNLMSDELAVIGQTLAVLTTNAIDIMDLASFAPTDYPDDIIITYGSRAKRMCENLRAKYKLELPDPRDLLAGLGDESIRQETYKKLLAFKKLLQQPVETPRNTEVIVEGKKNGKIVRVSNQQSQEADVNITPEELSLLKTFKEVLHVEDLHIVHSTSQHRKDASSTVPNYNDK